MKTIVSVCSARPNFVKVAAVHHAIVDSGADIAHVIVHTGQHYDPLFSDVFFEQLKIPTPAFNLGIHGGTREEVIEATKTAFAKILPVITPDIVLVYGDVNGAVGAAEATSEAGIALAHVEAGLRSFDLTMPEEHNRLAIDRLAHLLFCSEQSGMEHLKKEGVKGEAHLVGNTMIDTLLRMMPVIDATPLPIKVTPPFGVVTLHRPSNVDDPKSLQAAMSFLDDLSHHVSLILPAHHRLKHALEKFSITVPAGITMIDALGYVPFLRLLKDCSFVLTDSGGIQEETTLILKRCFTLRLNTERPSTIESGSNILINPQKAEDRETVLRYAQHPVSPAVTVPAFWDGHAGERIVRILVSHA